MDPKKKKQPTKEDFENAFNYFDSPKGNLDSIGKTDEEVQKQIEEDAKKRALKNLQQRSK